MVDWEKQGGGGGNSLEDRGVKSKGLTTIDLAAQSNPDCSKWGGRKLTWLGKLMKIPGSGSEGRSGVGGWEKSPVERGGKMRKILQEQPNSQTPARGKAGGK